TTSAPRPRWAGPSRVIADQPEPADQPEALLEGRDEGQGRLCALVVVAAARLEAVVPAASVRVEHGDPGVVVAQEPRHRPAHPGDEAPVAGQGDRAGTGVGQAGGFDRLLVVARTDFARRPS